MSKVTVGEVVQTLPDEYPVSVIMERRCSSNPWIDEQWEAVGITAGEAGSLSAAAAGRVKIHEDDQSTQYLYSGFVLRLYADECESYYHNLMTRTPRCYVVARPDEDEVPVPLLVGLSFDEAHAYLEAGDTIYAVDIPPEIYRWCEAFVLARYVPERKYKRKLKHWAPEGGCPE